MELLNGALEDTVREIENTHRRGSRRAQISIDICELQPLFHRVF